MKMMKKTMALAMAATMVLSIAACSQKQAPDGSKSNAQSSSQGEQKNDEFVYDPNNQYPGMVVYRDGDPEANVDVEITSTDKVTWTVATTLTETNPQSQAIARLGEELSERTNGNFTLDIFYNSKLGPESELVEMVRNNTAQFVASNVTLMASYVDSFGVFALPYLFHSEQDILTYLSTSEKAAEMYKQLESQCNLVTLGHNCTGARSLSTKGVPQFKDPSGLKGVKIRSMEAKVWQDVIKSLGATPVPVAYSELYTALQTGVVSGQENPIANTVDGKFYEVLDTFYENNHTYLVSGYYTNPEAWDALPDDYKALFEGLMEKYLGNYYHEEILKFTDEAKKIMTDKGVTFVGQDELDMDAFYESASKMVDEEYMKDEAYGPIIKDVRETFNY